MLGEGACLRQRGHRRRGGHRFADGQKHPLEELAVLGGADGGERSAQDADAVAIEDAGVGELDGEVESGLPAEGAEQAVRLLRLDDAFDDRGSERFDVHRVGDVVVSHDRRRIAVDEDDADALLAQRLARLRPRVVELRRLADDDGTAADHQHAARRGEGGSRGRRRQAGERGRGSRGGGDAHRAAVARRRRHREELVEHGPAVLRTGRSLRVVLEAEGGKLGVAQTLDAAVVEVALADEPAGGVGQGRAVDLELMVLRGDEDRAGHPVLDRMVATVVAELEPRGRCPHRPAQDLVTEADAQQRNPALQQLLAQTDRSGQVGGIARTVAEQHPVRRMAEDVVDGRVVTEDHHLGAAAAQGAQRVALHAVVEDGDPHPAEGAHPAGEPHRALQGVVERLVPELEGLADRDLRNQVVLGDRMRPAGELDLLDRRHRSGGGDHAAERASVAEVPRQRPGVDVAQPRHPAAAQLLVEGALPAGVPDGR